MLESDNMGEERTCGVATTIQPENRTFMCEIEGADSAIDRVDCNAIIPYSMSVDRRNRYMASITIRNLDDGIKRRLRVRAAEHGRSMEEEAREILREVVSDVRPPRNLARILRARMAQTGGVDLDIPRRDSLREPPAFNQ